VFSTARYPAGRSVGEAERIIEEYARRAAEIPPGRYEPTSRAELLMQQSKERAAVDLLARAGALPPSGKRVLEVGCGEGGWLPRLEAWGARRADLAGIDLLERDVERGRERLPGADLRVGDASQLPWDDASQDLVIQSTVFSSILDAAMRRAVAAEMGRVLAPGGVILWFDFFVDNPRNRNVKGVRRSEIETLFPGFELSARRVILAPPLTRLLARLGWIGVEALESVRLLNTHYMAVLRRAS
jgi:SAM-dependent methyltransferase